MTTDQRVSSYTTLTDAASSAAGDDRPAGRFRGERSAARATLAPQCGSSMRCGSARQSTARSRDRIGRIRAGDGRPGSSVGELARGESGRRGAPLCPGVWGSGRVITA